MITKARQNGLIQEKESMPNQVLGSPRIGMDLFNATRPFVKETPFRSWWCIGSTLAILTLSLFVAATAPWWPLQLVASILSGWVLVRMFILYHDYMHGSLLPRSRMAKLLFHGLGLVMLAPPRHWRYSHNYHHAHVGKIEPTSDDDFPVFISDIGSFPLISTDKWKDATAWQRLRYRISRHPMSILMAYLTIFVFVNCLVPLVRQPSRNWDGAVSIAIHFGLVAALWIYAGFGVAIFAMIIPFAIATMVGAYLFYAQHTYEGLHILPENDWSYFDGALESSSYMKLSPVMSWFTGNIGYHHVHHLNSRIPFYRLPEAMAGIPELQNPIVTTLSPREIVSCFRANLWDQETQKMVSYREAELMN